MELDYLYPLVEEEVFTKPPMEMYRTSQPCRSLLQNNIGSFLLYRTARLNGAQNLLPNFIKDMVNQLLQTRGNNSDEPQPVDSKTMRQYTETLCRLLGRYFPDAYYFIWHRRSVNRARQKVVDDGIAHIPNQAAVAAAVGDLATLKEIGWLDRSNLWTESPIFGYPLRAAAYAGQEKVVRWLVKQLTADLERIKDNVPVESGVFSRAICAAIYYQRSEIQSYLQGKFIFLFGLPGDKEMKSWLRAAIEVGNEKQALPLFQYRHNASINVIYSSFVLSCIFDRASICRLFFEKKFLELNQMYGSFYPLSSAIEKGTYGMVELLLEMGANPDGPEDIPKDEKRPLDNALNDAHGEPLVLLLVEKGANFHLSKDLKRSNFDLLRVLMKSYPDLVPPESPENILME